MRIVIVGGGFAGVKSALELSKNGFKDITLISDQDYFLHHATLYATATGRNRDESVIPLKDIFARHPQVKVVKDSAVSIDEARKLLVGKAKSYPYDTLILALGVVTNYFNIKGLAEHSYGIKTLPELEIFRNRICEVVQLDEHAHKNYVVVGAGPTGVELAAALREYIDEMCGHYNPKRTQLRVSLIEAAPRVLPRMSEVASEIVTQRLLTMGIEVLTSKKVESRSENDITVNGERLYTDTVIWTSGVTNHPFFKQNSNVFTLAKNGRVEVDEHFQAAPHIYVLGDNANTPYTGTAYTALHNAQYIATYLTALSQGKAVKPYRPKLFASYVPVGHNWAIIERKNFRLAGWLAAKIRRLVELRDYLYLVPFTKAWHAWRAHNIRDKDMTK